MIVLNVTYTMKEGVEATDFVAALEGRGLAPYCRKEKGNQSYRYFFPADGKEQVFLLEKWEDEDCLNAHMKTENFAKIGQTKGDFVETTDLQKYMQ